MQRQSLPPLIIGSNLYMPQGTEQIMDWYCGELTYCTAPAILLVYVHKIHLDITGTSVES